jgi:pimeloyl-ACP methyl ester carboxylesterase
VPYVTLEGVRLYYEEAGAGPPLVMIHGASQDTLSWHDNIPHFARSWHVHALDLPGHGKSALVQGRPTTSTAEFAAYIWRFIEAKRLHRPVLVGHSMGGGISIATAIDHPEAIRAVISVCGGAAFRGPTGVSYQPEVLRQTAINPTDWLETIFHSVLGRTTPKSRREEMAFDATRCSPYVAHADLLTYTTFNLNEAIEKIRVPVHYIVGEDDWSTTPDMARETSARLAALGVQSDCVELKGIGHIPHWEQPEAFNAVLDQVLARLTTDPRAA